MNLDAPGAARVQLLQDCFAAIARTRMAGLPLLHPLLRVEALGFEPVGGDGTQALCGVLVTPWFMNLVWLPLQRHDGGCCGEVQQHHVGIEGFAFVTAHEDTIGSFAACSLFSPMTDFADAAQARSTALAVLAQLRAVPPQTVQSVVPADVTPPARRSFLFGRSATRPAP